MYLGEGSLGQTRVADHDGASGLELLERGRHDVEDVERDCTRRWIDCNELSRRERERDEEERKVATREYLEAGRGGEPWAEGR